MSETKLAKRGFHEKNAAARELLETVGETFLTGYAYAAEAPSATAAEDRLEEITAPFRGFAYEGAAMAFAVRDGLPFGGHHAADLIAGRGRDHIYMAYVGIGWAMGRLPRFRWARATSAATDPLLRWLVLDGYGFHQAYFHTSRYIHEQHQERAFPWPAGGSAQHASRVIDQGIGRAMWFAAGSDADLVASMIDKFAPERRSDLYSGAGLAATYAGGSDEGELRAFWERAGEHRAYVAQASAFAAAARVRAGLVVPHTELATHVFCDMSPQRAWQVTERNRPTGPVSGAEPAYAVWRSRIAAEFAALRRS